MSSLTITETTDNLYGTKEFMTGHPLEMHHDMIVAKNDCSTSSSSTTCNKRKNTTKKNRTRNTPPPPPLENPSRPSRESSDEENNRPKMQKPKSGNDKTPIITSKCSIPPCVCSKSKRKDPAKPSLDSKRNPSSNELQDCPFVEQHVKSLLVNLELEDDPRYLGKNYCLCGAICGICSLELSNKVSYEERKPKTLFRRKVQCFPFMCSRTSQYIACKCCVCAACCINLNSMNDGLDGKRQISQCKN